MSPVDLISVIVIGMVLAWAAVIVAFPVRRDAQRPEDAGTVAEGSDR